MIKAEFANIYMPRDGDEMYLDLIAFVVGPRAVLAVLSMKKVAGRVYLEAPAGRVLEWKRGDATWSVSGEVDALTANAANEALAALRETVFPNLREGGPFV